MSQSSSGGHTPRNRCSLKAAGSFREALQVSGEGKGDVKAEVGNAWDSAGGGWGASRTDEGAVVFVRGNMAVPPFTSHRYSAC